jgi:hypothetical protein
MKSMLLHPLKSLKTIGDYLYVHSISSRMPLTHTLVLVNVLLWGINFAMPGSMVKRSTMLLFGEIGDDTFWATVFFSVFAFYAYALMIEKSQKVLLYALAVSALLHWLALVLLLFALWPPAALISSHVSMTLCATYLFVTRLIRAKGNCP